MSDVKRITYSVQETAEMLGVSQSFLYQYLDRNPSIPRVYFGKRILIPAQLLAEYILNSGKAS